VAWLSFATMHQFFDHLQILGLVHKPTPPQLNVEKLLFDL
jgi:hypothetical protein